MDASLGYLRARVDPYGFDAADGQRRILGGRAPAHAPQWSLRLGSTYTHRLGLFARAAWSLTDKFYFSDSHDLQAEGYQIVNGSVGYEKGTWSLTLWGRNVLDERYAVRGFYFGLCRCLRLRRYALSELWRSASGGIEPCRSLQ